MCQCPHALPGNTFAGTGLRIGGTLRSARKYIRWHRSQKWWNLMLCQEIHSLVQASEMVESHALPGNTFAGTGLTIGGTLRSARKYIGWYRPQKLWNLMLCQEIHWLVQASELVESNALPGNTLAGTCLRIGGKLRSARKYIGWYRPQKWWNLML